MNKLLKSILHLFFWTVYFLIAGFLSFGLDKGLGFVQEMLSSFILSTVWSATAFYSFYFFLYRYIARRQFGRYFVYSVLASLSISGFFIGIVYIFIVNKDLFFSYEWALTTTAGTFVIANCGSLLRGFIIWVDASQRHEETLRRNLNLELDVLRSQINPHFLFNTLNNIDALIFSRPEQASDMVISLSSIMRYMLYETCVETVPVGKEADHLANIIKLQSIRFARSEYIRWRCDLDDPDTLVAPLLFVPFVENACKFAAFTGSEPVIDICLTHVGREIRFECSNTFGNNVRYNNEMGGIGLENVRKRLNLLYPGLHKLEISEKDAKFKVLLFITIC